MLAVTFLSKVVGTTYSREITRSSFLISVLVHRPILHFEQLEIVDD